MNAGAACCFAVPARIADHDRIRGTCPGQRSSDEVGIGLRRFDVVLSRPGIGELPGVELVVDEGVEVRLDRGTREDDRMPEVLQLRHQLVRAVEGLDLRQQLVEQPRPVRAELVACRLAPVRQRRRQQRVVTDDIES